MFEQQQTASPDRRKSPRFPAHEQVILRSALSGPSLPGRLRDVSCDGCLVGLKSPASLEVADVIELRLLADCDDLQVLGAVRHTTPDGLLAGLEFLRDGAQQANEVAAFLSVVQRRSASELSESAS